MDQRVTHAAVTGNKRPGAGLAYVKEMQEKAPPKPKVRTNSEKMGYRPRGRKNDPPEAATARKWLLCGLFCRPLSEAMVYASEKWRLL